MQSEQSKKAKVMATITLDNQTYNAAASYANIHNVSISDAIKAGLQLLIGNNSQHESVFHIRPVSELHPSVQELIGIARREGEPEIKDINGESSVEEYLIEKYK